MGSSNVNSTIPKTKLIIWLISASAIISIVLRFSLPISVIIKETWSVVVLCWLKPPYLYIVINSIIIAIAASSLFHASQSQPSVGDGQQDNLITVKTPPPSVFASSLPPQQEVGSTAEVEAASRVVELKPDDGEKSEVGFDVNEDELFNQLVEEEEEIEDRVDVVDESTASGYSAPPTQENMSGWMTAESLLPAREKPLVSSRFGHRRSIRTGNTHGGEVRAPGVSRPKKQETLESTWKKITEGRRLPLTRLSKTKLEDGEHVISQSETYKEGKSNNNKKFDEDMKKTKRFNLRIHKELSPDHVELNRRVEAFINKFNEDMKMQRQESLNRFMEMINRGK